MNQRIQNILVKYFSKSASEKELIELTEWLKEESNVLLFEEFIRTNYLIDHCMLDFDTNNEKRRVLDKIKSEERRMQKIGRLVFLKYAAVILVLLGGVFTYVFNSGKFYKNEEEKKTVTVPVDDVMPGHDKAILTLENGDEVVLEKEMEVQLKQANQEGERLVYKRNPKTDEEKEVYNFLTIPKGGQFFVQLSDGTKVWLNSDSKLKYPVKFLNGRPRKVELLYGEAYFEVTKSKGTSEGDIVSHFLVQSKSQEIDVLGTQFNIKAYQGEKNITTTLVEGKIAIASGNAKKTLKPMEQAIVDQESPGSFSIKKVSKVFDEIAWKEGYFSFRQKSMEDIMMVLSRWYDVEYTFQDSQKRTKTFTGVLDRGNTISQILINIQKTNEINYKIKDKTVIIN